MLPYYPTSPQDEWLRQFQLNQQRQFGNETGGIQGVAPQDMPTTGIAPAADNAATSLAQSQSMQKDPFGPTMGMFREQDPYQNSFMFSQDPNSMTPPSYGIAPGGGVQGSPDMQPQLTEAGASGGSDWGSTIGALASAAGKAGAAPQMPQAQRMGGGGGMSLGGMPKEYRLEFLLPLAELVANREAAQSRLRKKR
jgi:hypothetical protein